MGLMGLMGFLNRLRILEPIQLENCNLIVDGNNFSGKLFDICAAKGAGGCGSYGGDYNVIYLEVRRIIKDFIECGVHCYFVYDGGHNERTLQKKRTTIPKRLQNVIHDSCEKVTPIFLDDVVIDVLIEMEVPYVMCVTGEADEVIAALAADRQCPILSGDSDFFLCEYGFIVMHDGSKFNFFRPNKENFIRCKIFDRTKFLARFNVSLENIPLICLILKRQEELPYKRRVYDNFFRANHIKTQDIINSMIAWQRFKRPEDVENIFMDCIRPDLRDKCREMLRGIGKIVYGSETTSVAFKFLTNNESTVIGENDIDWFDKGVACRHIPKPYINLYHHKLHLFFPQENFEADDSFLPCLRILRYALDLLTGFGVAAFRYVGRTGRQVAKDRIIEKVDPTLSLEAPSWGSDCIFRSGWRRLPNGFGYFLEKTLPNLPLQRISTLPPKFQLSTLALVWWRRYAARSAEVETYCLLLCWVMGRQTDPSTTAASVTYDASRLHALVQYQHVLYHLGCLSRLCASEYTRPRMEHLYCGSFLRGKVYAASCASEPLAQWVEKQLPEHSGALFRQLRDVFQECAALIQ